MGRRILNDALRSMVNAEKRGKAMVELKPISTVISSFLQIMKHRGNYSTTPFHYSHIFFHMIEYEIHAGFICFVEFHLDIVIVSSVLKNFAAAKTAAVLPILLPSCLLFLC